MGTRLLGAKIRADLRPLLDGDEKVVLDFTGVVRYFPAPFLLNSPG